MPITLRGKEYRYLSIEQARGATYSYDTFAVYGHGTYAKGSVLEGQDMRVWIAGGFKTIEEAKIAYPDADVSGSSYAPPYLGHLPDPDGPDPLGDNQAIYEEMQQETCNY